MRCQGTGLGPVQHPLGAGTGLGLARHGTVRDTGLGPVPVREDTAPVREGAGMAAPLQTGAGMAAPLQKGAGVAAPLREGTGMAAPLQDGTEVAAPVREGAAPVREDGPAVPVVLHGLGSPVVASGVAFAAVPSAEADGTGGVACLAVVAGHTCQGASGASSEDPVVRQMEQGIHRVRAGLSLVLRRASRRATWVWVGTRGVLRTWAGAP